MRVLEKDHLMTALERVEHPRSRNSKGNNLTDSEWSKAPLAGAFVSLLVRV